jgi:hypothetical protein
MSMPAWDVTMHTFAALCSAAWFTCQVLVIVTVSTWSVAFSIAATSHGHSIPQKRIKQDKIHQNPSKSINIHQHSSTSINIHQNPSKS